MFVLVFVDSKNACHQLQPWFLGDNKTCIEACNERKDILAVTKARSNTFISFCTLIFTLYSIVLTTEMNYSYSHSKSHKNFKSYNNDWKNNILIDNAV